jgi:hypothetical protein
MPGGVHRVPRTVRSLLVLRDTIELRSD